jgi:hypothetical protein
MSYDETGDTLSNVSLFPFLAVLVCTIGVLIVLLVMAVQCAHEQVARGEAQDSQLVERTDELVLRRDLETFRVAELTELRPAIVEQLGDARRRRGHYEYEIQRLHERARQLESETANLQAIRKDKIGRVDPSADEYEQLKGQLAAEVAALDAARQAAEAQPITYAIIPHTGPNGTLRRPIYVECTRNALIIQPIGVRLTPDQFTKPVVAGNPFDAALLAVARYWTEHNVAGEHGEPYPLLVVRPDGTAAFALARQAMKSWEEEFGYELVSADIVLDYGPPDPALAEVVQQSIQHALVQQQALWAMLESQHSQGMARQLDRSHRRDEWFEPIVTEFSATPAATPSASRGGNSPVTSHVAADDQTEQGGEAHAAGATHSAANADAASEVAGSNMPPGAAAASQAARYDGPHGSVHLPPNFESLAASRGDDWALPTRTPGAVAYRRPIRIECSGDELVVDPGRIATLGRTIIRWDGSTERSIDPLVHAVWRVIDSWGIAGSNGYWRPTLRVHVGPGGAQRAAELEQLLAHSGIDWEIVKR